MVTNNIADQHNVGIQSLTTGGVFNGRTLTGTSNQISVSNGDGTGGNPTFSLTSTIQVSGISFDSGSNTLSNYATGTFTPSVTNSGSAPTVSYSIQVGRYTRIGNRVTAVISLTCTAYTAGTGTVRISGLPITSNNTANNNTTCAISMVQTTFGAVTYYIGTLPSNSTVISIDGVVSAAGFTSLAAAGPSATSAFAITITYEV